MQESFLLQKILHPTMKSMGQSFQSSCLRLADISLPLFEELDLTERDFRQFR